MAETSIAEHRPDPSPGFLAAPDLSFPAVFALRCARTPDAVAFHDVPWGTSGLNDPRALTYAHLEGRARRASAMLEAVGVTRGDRVLLCVEGREAFFSFFLGAEALGAVPVPLPAASDSRLPAVFRERIVSVAADCAPRAIVADDRESLVIVDADLPPSVGRVDASAIDGDPTLAAGAATFDLARSLDEWAFIQYTSGSTGSPKGVVVTHGNLVANLRASAEAGGFGPDDRSVFWLPLFHDMGLVGGLLFGIYLGIPTFALPPRSFVSRPHSWLRAISQYRATFTMGPNFAYSVLSGRLPDRALAGLDLSSWRLAFNGAEPIDRATVEAFIRRFEPYGFRATSFYPVYGMAETTLATAFPAPGRPVDYDTVDRATLSTTGVATPAAAGSAGTTTFVSVGRAMPGHRLIVRAVGGDSELPERHVGEIVASGPSVTPFYYADRKGTARTELRTGDLGYRVGEDLYVVDRLKDLLIIAGRNLIPSDIERVATTVEGVRYGAVIAFARPGPDGTEELYLVVGVEPGAARSEGMAGRIRRRVHEHFGVVARDVVLVEPRRIPKTSSGKNRRSACRDLYETGQLSAVGAGPELEAKAAVTA